MQDLKAIAVNSTTVMLIWEPVEVIQRNGLIISYQINWINTCLMGGNTTLNDTEMCAMSLSRKTGHYGNITISSEETSVTLTDFVVYTRYEFRISASTSKGEGPWLTRISETLEDGKRIQLCVFIYNFVASFYGTWDDVQISVQS